MTLPQPRSTTTPTIIIPDQLPTFKQNDIFIVRGSDIIKVLDKPNPVLRDILVEIQKHPYRNYMDEAFNEGDGVYRP